MTLLIPLTMIACGKKSSQSDLPFVASPGVEGDAADPGLFAADYKVGFNKETIIGLWETNEYEIKEGHKITIRYNFSEDDITITKMCRYKDGTLTFSSIVLAGEYKEGVFVLSSTGSKTTYTSLNGNRYGCIAGIDELTQWNEENIFDGIIHAGGNGQITKIG